MENPFEHLLCSPTFYTIWQNCTTPLLEPLSPVSARDLYSHIFSITKILYTLHTHFHVILLLPGTMVRKSVIQVTPRDHGEQLNDLSMCICVNAIWLDHLALSTELWNVLKVRCGHSNTISSVSSGLYWVNRLSVLHEVRLFFLLPFIFIDITPVS